MERPQLKIAGELEFLDMISRLLSAHESLEGTLERVLQKLADFFIARMCSMALFNRERGEIYIEKAYGLSSQQKSKGRYKLGEGITGAVVESGLPAIIPDIRQEPRFLSRTHERNLQNTISFICIPVRFHNEVLGTLSMEQVFKDEANLARSARVLGIVAFMVSELVSIHRLEHERSYEENLRLKNENVRLKAALEETHPSNIIGNSSLMHDVYQLVNRVARTSASVLLLGESGVGKELVAEAIHQRSERQKMPMIKVNCAALPESIIESELFGYERGAFTGAVQPHSGRFEQAAGGTLFLDEIGEISPNVQTKLLRVLQEKQIERLGSERSIHVDVRIIAATNKDLLAMVEDGTFRADLYYRLNVFPILVPPLRERKADIPQLIDYFVAKYALKFSIEVKRVSTPAIDMLMAYHWPGNVRELQNCLERAVLLCEDGVIRSYHLPPTLQSPESSNTRLEGGLFEKLDAIEREMIVEALKDSQGNIAKAAKRLGLTERAMGLRVHKYQLNYKHFRVPTQK